MAKHERPFAKSLMQDPLRTPAVSLFAILLTLPETDYQETGNGSCAAP